jgi:hypothetical protein
MKLRAQNGRPLYGNRFCSPVQSVAIRTRSGRIPCVDVTNGTLLGADLTER